MTAVRKDRDRVSGGAEGREATMQIPSLGPLTESLSGGGIQELTMKGVCEATSSKCDEKESDLSLL